MQYELLEKLIPYDHNPRDNTKAVDKVVSSIQEFGFQQPIVVDKNHVIIVGHTRFLAAKKLKLETVPVIIADNLTPLQVKIYRLVDNRLHEIAKWDKDLLSVELEELKALGYDVWFTDFEDDIPPEDPTLLEDISANVFEVVATCADEADQEAIYKLMTAKGFQCRVLSM